MIHPCPKPAKREKKPRTPLPRPTKRIRGRNPKRAKRLFTEDFGSKEYLEYIHSLPCAICGALCEFTEAAHVRSRGAGGKASDLVPLCGNRPFAGGCNSRAYIVGCHFHFDEHDPIVRSHEMRLRSLAKKLYADFQAVSQRKGS